MTEGKWLLSYSEERWTVNDEYDSKEEAMADAKRFAEEYGAERVWVGQIDKITLDELAEAGVDARRIVDDIDEYIYEQVGEIEDNDLPCNREQEKDLTERVKATVKQWLIDHKIEPYCYRIERVKSIDIEEDPNVEEAEEAKDPPAS